MLEPMSKLITPILKWGFNTGHQVQYETQIKLQEEKNKEQKFHLPFCSLNTAGVCKSSNMLLWYLNMSK